MCTMLRTNNNPNAVIQDLDFSMKKVAVLKHILLKKIRPKAKNHQR